MGSVYKWEMDPAIAVVVRENIQLQITLYLDLSSSPPTLGGVGHNAGGVDPCCLFDLLPFLCQVSKTILIKECPFTVPYLEIFKFNLKDLLSETT